MTPKLRPPSTLIQRVDALSALATVLIAVVSGLVVVGADLLTGSEISFSIFYVAPVSILAWRLGRDAAHLGAVAGAVAWYVVELIGGRDYSQPLVPLWNGLVRFGFFIIIGELLVVLHEAHRIQARDARVDPLTGLLNRRGFAEHADIELSRARRSRQPFTIVFFDLDHFKRLNDTSGHAAGDAVLTDVGARTQALLRHADVIARMGGDEFAVLLPETPAAQARVIVERLRTELSPITQKTGVGFSFGVVTFDNAPLEVDSVEAPDAQPETGANSVTPPSLVTSPVKPARSARRPYTVT